MRPAIFKALEHPHFRRFWQAQMASLIGSWMQGSAQAWLVLGLYADPAEATARLGIVSALQWTPSLLLSLFAGAVLDRVSRKAVLMASQTTLMLTALGLGTAVALGRVSFEAVAALALLAGVANAFDIVARQSMVPGLVPREAMQNAVALNSLAFNAARVLGAAVFGLLSPLLGLAAIFYLNAASFLVVLRALVTIPVPSPEPHRNNVLEDIRAGLGYVWETPAVRGPILLLGALSITVINFQVIIPAFAKNALGLFEAGFGALGAAFGAGAVLGALWHASRPSNERRRLMRRGAFLLCASVGLLALAPSLLAAALALVGAGAGMILFTVSANSSVQLATPDRLRGRVMSVYALVFAGMSPFGALVVGGLMAALGPRGGVALVAALGLAAAVALRPRAPRELPQPAD